MTMNRRKFIGAGMSTAAFVGLQPGGLGAIARTRQDRCIRADVG